VQAEDGVHLLRLARHDDVPVVQHDRRVPHVLLVARRPAVQLVPLAERGVQFVFREADLELARRLGGDGPAVAGPAGLLRAAGGGGVVGVHLADEREGLEDLLVEAAGGGGLVGLAGDGAAQPVGRRPEAVEVRDRRGDADEDREHEHGHQQPLEELHVKVRSAGPRARVVARRAPRPADVIPVRQPLRQGREK
jgi:hypothetical protein